MAQKHPRLGADRWKTLKPKCQKAGTQSEESMKAWAAISAEAVAGHPHADWGWVLADLQEYCYEDGIECPYQKAYLIQLADTYEKVEGNFDRDVPVSVLVEGRFLTNMLKVIKPGMTVVDVRALVYKQANPNDDRSVEEIKAEQKRHRLDGREKAKRKDHAEKIGNWKLDKADELLPMLKDEATAYGNALVRLGAEGAVFNTGDVAVALHALRGLAQTLETLYPPLANAA